MKLLVKLHTADKTELDGLKLLGLSLNTPPPYQVELIYEIDVTPEQAAKIISGGTLISGASKPLKAAKVS